MLGAWAWQFLTNVVINMLMGGHDVSCPHMKVAPLALHSTPLLRPCLAVDNVWPAMADAQVDLLLLVTAPSRTGYGQPFMLVITEHHSAVNIVAHIHKHVALPAGKHWTPCINVILLGHI